MELMYEFAETIDLCGKPKRVYIDRKQVFENAFFVRKAPWYEQLWFKLRFNFGLNLDSTQRNDQFIR